MKSSNLTMKLVSASFLAMMIASPALQAKSGASGKAQIHSDDLPDISSVEKAESCEFVKDKARSLKSKAPFVIRGKDKEKKTVCSGRIKCNMIPSSLTFDSESEISCGFAEANKACDARECLIQYIKDREHLDAQLKSFEKPIMRATTSDNETQGIGDKE